MKLASLLCIKKSFFIVSYFWIKSVQDTTYIPNLGPLACFYQKITKKMKLPPLKKNKSTKPSKAKMW